MDDLLGFEFDVEDGRAAVTGVPDWADRGQYLTVAVKRPDGSTYTTVRSTELVRRRYLEG